MGVMPKIMGGYVYNNNKGSQKHQNSQRGKIRGGVSKKGGKKGKKRKTKKAGCGY